MTRLFDALNELSEPWRLTPENADEHRRRLAKTGSLLAGPLADSVLAEVCAAAAVHPDPWLRATLLRGLVAAAPGAPDVAAAVVWLTHDPEDFVCFEALRAASGMRLQAALPDLLMFVGSASERLVERPGKPVGVGHAVVLRAIVEIAGTDDPGALASIEAEIFRGTHEFPTEWQKAEEVAPPVACGNHRHTSMAFVPAGRVRFGIPASVQAAGPSFDWDDVREGRSHVVGPFWIDREPITATDYDAFATSDAAHLHTYCHPNEPPEKLHVRNTLLDPRFGPDHPVTGVDWFDAYAYAAARGKRLLTEAEWQRAGQGDGDSAFPWGDEFDDTRVQWVGRVLGRKPHNIAEWRRELVALSERETGFLTAAVGEFDDMSPFGVRGLSGNAWEWTGTNFFTGANLDPDVGERDALEVVYDWRSYPVIRGGTWSSLPELTSIAFRGKDLITDRHFENGFRCACDCPPHR